MKDWRGWNIGYLLLLHDVTGAKRDQAQIVEQQRALATLSERESMARELHDGLGQVMGYASFQVEAAARLARAGEGESAAVQLERLGGILRDAHADVRQVILNLRSAPSSQQPFFTVMQQYLEGFTNNYGIQASLEAAPALGEEPIPPDLQLQVFRILQEALANARKHGQPRRVRVVFAAEDGLTRLTVEDDGLGFTPGAEPESGSQHFGLQFMRERARQFGGRLELQSAPGAGARVVLDIPRKEP